MKRIGILMMTLALALGLMLPVSAAGSDELLTLVNPWNTVPAGWESQLVSIGNGHRVDKRCQDDLHAMLEACRAAGYKPVVRSSYRSHATQQQLYANKVNQWKGYGYNDAEACKKAATIVAPAGTSEHQLGLALDIVDNGYRTLDERQADTATQQWLMAHSWEYGFILRYPVDKSAVTGIIYEPWHYRYVGRDNAKAIFESGLCLEEWLLLQENIRAVEAAIDQQVQQARRKSYVSLWHKNTVPAAEAPAV